MPSRDREALEDPGLGCHLFVSYASDDRDRVLKLRDRLIVEPAVASVWVDKPEIDPGDRWQKEIRNGLRRTQITLAVLTRHSVDPKREWIVYEHRQSARLHRPIIPLRFDDSEPPPRLAELEYADFRADWEAGFRRLLDAIGKRSRRLGRQFADQSPPARHVFVGREDKVRAVAEMILEQGRDVDTGRRSVAIQAMGGMGKSMLAAEVVRRLGPLFPGGVLYVDRGKGAEDAQLVLQRWVEQVDGRYPERQMKPAEVRDRLRKFGELLVLIDDVGESDFPATRILLDALPPDASRLLTTRSTKIKRDLGARLYPLDRLSEEDGLTLLADRLRRLDQAPDEQLLRQVVVRLGGHPLSLELIAARCDQTSDLPRLVAELEDILETGELGLEALEIEEEGQKDKYRSVAASLALSFAGLERIDAAAGSDLARRFVALGIFPGGGLFDQAMAGAAWGTPVDQPATADHRALDVFVRRAMLDLDPETELYLLHPLMRAFAYERLRRDGERFSRVRARYIRRVVESARAVYRQPPEEWRRYRRYERHLQYVARGLLRGVPETLGIGLGRLGGPRREMISGVLPRLSTWGKRWTKPEELVLGSDFADAVRELVVRRPELGRRGRDWLKIGLACARVLGQKLRTIRYLRELGRWHLRRGAKRAEQYLAEAVRRARRGRKEAFRQQEGIALSYQGEALRVRGRPQEAIAVLQRALEIHRRLDDRFMIATTLKFLGETHWRRGRLDRARAKYQEAQQIFDGMGLRAQGGDMFNKIGSVHFNAGRQEEALPWFLKALAIHREVGNRAMETEDLNDLGISYKYLGRLDEAKSKLEEAVGIAREIGYGRLESISLSNLANVYHERRQYGEAQRQAEAAYRRAVEVEDRVSQAWALSWIGVADQQAGEYHRAAERFRRALELSRETENLRGEAAFNASLGQLQVEHLGQREAGIAHLREAIRLLESNGLEQAYGGRRIEDFRRQLAAAEAADRD